VLTLIFVPSGSTVMAGELRVGFTVEARHRHELGRRGDRGVRRPILRIGVRVGGVLAALGEALLGVGIEPVDHASGERGVEVAAAATVRTVGPPAGPRDRAGRSGVDTKRP
jgi:hypothetical protein